MARSRVGRAAGVGEVRGEAARPARDRAVAPDALAEAFGAAFAAFAAFAGLAGFGSGRPSHGGTVPNGSGCGFWAWCGWSGPSYTASLVIMARPSRFFGSIPRTADST